MDTTTQNEAYLLLRQRGRRYLIRGVIFLAFCFGIAQVLRGAESALANLLSESLIIAGWVALWRPMEIYLYDLPDLKRQERGLQV